jgi:hypothetical protein
VLLLAHCGAVAQLQLVARSLRTVGRAVDGPTAAAHCGAVAQLQLLTVGLCYIYV